MSASVRRLVRRDVALGDEREWMGNTVRPVRHEVVTQNWVDGRVVSESSEVVETGKLALVMPATFAEGDIGAFARQIEIAAADQQSLWHEGL